MTIWDRPQMPKLRSQLLKPPQHHRSNWREFAGDAALSRVNATHLSRVHPRFILHIVRTFTIKSPLKSGRFITTTRFTNTLPMLQASQSARGGNHQKRQSLKTP
jgi:hypothetical protein